MAIKLFPRPNKHIRSFAIAYGDAQKNAPPMQSLGCCENTTMIDFGLFDGPQHNIPSIRFLLWAADWKNYGTKKVHGDS